MSDFFYAERNQIYIKTSSVEIVTIIMYIKTTM